MASVLGTSRGSGGLSGQLRCKSKRRRRRRSKRKGKDLAFCAASTNCTLLCLARVVPPLQQLRCGVLGGVRSKQSAPESRSLCKGPGGLLRAQRGLRAADKTAAGSAQPGCEQPGSRAGRDQGWGSRALECSTVPSLVPSLARAPQPGSASDPLRGDISTRCQRKHSLKPAAPETGTGPGASGSIQIVSEEGVGTAPAVTFPNWPTVPT